MTLKRLQLFAGSSNQITAWNVNQGNIDDVAIVEITGWDDGVEIRRNSAPILWEDGEAQSTNALYGPRHLEITFFAQRTPTEMRTLRSQIENVMSNLNVLRTVSVTQYNNGTEFYKEELRCRFEDNGMDWVEINGTVTVTLHMVAPNPLKTVYINGSTTPATSGRI